MLKKMLTTPPVKRIDLVFPLGLEVTARNLRGVTIKDALDAIYKQFKKKVRSAFWPCSPLPSPLVPNLTFFPGRRRVVRPLPQGLRMGPRRMLHALHRAPDEDRREARGRRGQEEEEGQGRGGLNELSSGKQRMPPALLLVTVTRFGCGSSQADDNGCVMNDGIC